MLREMLAAAAVEDQRAPPEVPRFLSTPCNNCPAARLALLIALKDKVGPRPESKKRKQEAD